MRYNQSRFKGNYIGSGAIEGENKYIEAGGLKRTGMGLYNMLMF